MDSQIKADANKVIDRLKHEIGQLVGQNTILSCYIEELESTIALQQKTIETLERNNAS